MRKRGVHALDQVTAGGGAAFVCNWCTGKQGTRPEAWSPASCSLPLAKAPSSQEQETSHLGWDRATLTWVGAQVTPPDLGHWRAWLWPSLKFIEQLLGLAIVGPESGTEKHYEVESRSHRLKVMKTIGSEQKLKLKCWWTDQQSGKPSAGWGGGGSREAADLSPGVGSCSDSGGAIS